MLYPQVYTAESQRLNLPSDSNMCYPAERSSFRRNTFPQTYYITRLYGRIIFFFLLYPKLQDPSVPSQ